MKSAFKLIVIALVVLAIVWWYRSRGPSPEERLARHFDDICEIAADHVKSPERGVESLFAYLGKHSPTMMKHLGATVVTVQKASDHERRARKARDRMRAPLVRCAPTLERFFNAVERDEAARTKLEAGLERLARTLEILFGAGGSHAIEDWLPDSSRFLSR
jgi:hypothetical protein